MRTTFQRVADAIDRLNAAAGRVGAWCCLFIVVAQFAVVVLRYVFGMGSIAAQEAVLYADAALFLLASAWTLQIGGHVRVDIFYAPAKPRTRAGIDLFGALLLLLPFATVLTLLSLPYVERSWAIHERSRETIGLPFIYLFKSLIPVFAALIGLQGVAQAIRALIVLIAPPSQETR